MVSAPRLCRSSCGICTSRSGLSAVLLRIDASAGLTSDLQRRLACHNAGQNVHTANERPWVVIVSLEFRTEAAARAFERYLKSGSGRAFAKKHFP